MADCPHVASCELFPVFTQRPVLEVWMTNYCRADYHRCARYQRACRGESAPTTLLPNGRHLKVLKP